ncbi:hypothetical protein BDV11DRAFT_52629 [Aspergillus similis]
MWWLRLFTYPPAIVMSICAYVHVLMDSCLPRHAVSLHHTLDSQQADTLNYATDKLPRCLCLRLPQLNALLSLRPMIPFLETTGSIARVEDLGWKIAI